MKKNTFYKFRCLTCKSKLNISTIAKKASKHKENPSTKQNMDFASVIMQKNITTLEI